MKSYKIKFKKYKKYLVAKVESKNIGFTFKSLWCPSPSLRHRTKPYPLPKKIVMGARDNMDCSSKFTPPPFVIVIQNGQNKIAISVKANRGWHLWNFITFYATKDKVEIKVDFEGFTSLDSALKNIQCNITEPESHENNWGLLKSALNNDYPDVYKKSININKPNWWTQPIYCGWGDQVATSIHMEGPGAEERALNYCTQGLYTRWLNRLEKAELPIGTVCIDNGWSLAGDWEPIKTRWPNMREFIDQQHKKGRKVILWIATWLMEGLAKEWCIKIGDTVLTADPTNKEYMGFIKKMIYKLISPEKGCLNADGFKIDQLGYTPTINTPHGGENFGRTFSLNYNSQKIHIDNKKLWGLELLYLLQKEIYETTKKIKKEALITSSTVHPYFRDTFDMIRLHDTGTTKTDVFSAMKVRTDLAQNTLPNFLIDTDNWVHTRYSKWLNYSLNSYKLGVPCIFYSEFFPIHSPKEGRFKSVIPIPLNDLVKITQVWKKYIKELPNN